jgi:citrate synthase
MLVQKEFNMSNAALQVPKKTGGLDGVSIGTTVLSDVDGERGRLTIAGYDVEALALRHTFEDAALLLLEGSLPDAEARLRFRARLAADRRAVQADLAVYGNALRLKNPLESLRAAVALLEERATFPATASLVLAAIPVFIGGWYHQQHGTAMPATEDGHSTAEALLHVLGVQAPTPDMVRGLNGYLLTVSDHGMNASTFTARVIASTQSDTISAVTGAIGALKGPLHGGAPGPVLAMLDEIGSADRAAAWIRNKLAAGERIMGMGHRIYRVRDPRAAVFEGLLQNLDGHPATAERLALARTVEREAERQLAILKPDRPLKANVEFYTAVLLEACGVPGELFTAVFAAGRAAGWLAHIKEQKETGRLIRPSVDYVGAQRQL